MVVAAKRPAVTLSNITRSPRQLLTLSNRKRFLFTRLLILPTRRQAVIMRLRGRARAPITTFACLITTENHLRRLSDLSFQRTNRKLISRGSSIVGPRCDKTRARSHGTMHIRARAAREECCKILVYTPIMARVTPVLARLIRAPSCRCLWRAAAQKTTFIHRQKC